MKTLLHQKLLFQPLHNLRMLSTNNMQKPWIDLKIPPTELRLTPTLLCGQSFRWKNTGDSEYTCAIFSHVIDLKQTPTTILYRSLNNLLTTPDIEVQIRDYFQLNISLDKLTKTWCLVDPRFQEICTKQMGVRILRQPVVETLFAFIASANNNIKRITGLIDRLCQKYGKPMETKEKGVFYGFPSAEDMAQDKNLENSLKDLGFGYRAKYYHKTVTLLTTMPDMTAEEFLLSLRSQPLEYARRELLKFSGVGPKVADCVCLMALDKHQAVPIDTHIWKVAVDRYAKIMYKKTNLIKPPKDKVELVNQLCKTLVGTKSPGTNANEAAQQLVLALFGEYAGWAQGMLFSNQLPATDSKKNEPVNVKIESTEQDAIVVSKTIATRSSKRKRT